VKRDPSRPVQELHPVVCNMGYPTGSHRAASECLNRRTGRFVAASSTEYLHAFAGTKSYLINVRPARGRDDEPGCSLTRWPDEHPDVTP
jgi:hypothetical protein